MNDNTRLCHAALEGDVSYLQDILRKDPNVLRRCMIQNSSSFMQSPLHIASKNGHLQFVNVILQHPAQLAKDIFQPYGCLSPLHLASEMGHLEIVKALLEANPNMCLTEDEHGRNPIHIAAMMGNVEVFKELVRVNPQAARKRANGGETYLHLCIEYGQTQALTQLLRLTVDLALLNATDSRGDTILHYAVHTKNFEMVQNVVNDKRIEKSVKNEEMLTALDTQILLTGEKLKVRFQFINPKMIRWNDEDRIGPYLEDAYIKSANVLTYFQKLLNQDEWLERNRNSMPVVASLIAAMSFQIGISPPGGTWQDSDFDHNLNVSHVPGASIISSTFSKANIPDFKTLMTYNTLALLSSLTVILLSLMSNIVSFSRSRSNQYILFLSYILLASAVGCTMIIYIHSTSFLLRASNKYHFFMIPGVSTAFIITAIVCSFFFVEQVLLQRRINIHRRKLQSQITLNTVP